MNVAKEMLQMNTVWKSRACVPLKKHTDEIFFIWADFIQRTTWVPDRNSRNFCKFGLEFAELFEIYHSALSQRPRSESAEHNSEKFLNSSSILGSAESHSAMSQAAQSLTPRCLRVRMINRSKRSNIIIISDACKERFHRQKKNNYTF